jgi:ABC-type transport system substrate-binding protein
VTAQYVAQYIWEPLNGVNSRTNELIAGMASLPEISEDHLTYTYTINPNARFSDGKPVTGDDVVFSFKTVMNPVRLRLLH